MNLEEFISDTLVGIQRGVLKAIQETTSDKGAINPSWKPIGEDLKQDVRFDIAVTVADTAGLTGGGGIKVVGLQVGAEGSTSTESKNVSRIQFAVPIIPPVQVVQNEDT